MTHSIFTLDTNYSTTRLVSTIPPKIEDHPEAKFQTQLFVPEGEGRQGEGGLRTKGYYKHSYEVVDGQWYITDNFGLSEEYAQRIPVAQDQVPDALLEYVQNELRQADDEAEAEGAGREYSGQHIKLPLISVITVVFNGEKYLAETIESVVKQDYPNVEYIVVDGCSTDNTLDVVKSYEEQIDYWVSEKDQGIYDAMNKGIGRARGVYIGLLNADDLLLSDGLAMVVEALEDLGKPGYTCGAVELIDETGKAFGSSTPFPEKQRLRRQHIEMPCPHLGVFVHRSVYEQLGRFDTSFRLSADYDLILRFIENGVPCARVELPIGQFRTGGCSGGMETWLETFAVHRKHGKNIVLSMYVFVRSVVKSNLAGVMPSFVKVRINRVIPSKNKYKPASKTWV